MRTGVVELSNTGTVELGARGIVTSDGNGVVASGAMGIVAIGGSGAVGELSGTDSGGKVTVVGGTLPTTVVVAGAVGTSRSSRLQGESPVTLSGFAAGENDAT